VEIRNPKNEQALNEVPCLGPPTLLSANAQTNQPSKRYTAITPHVQNACEPRPSFGSC
jgi:hypothetical protein